MTNQPIFGKFNFLITGKLKTSKIIWQELRIAELVLEDECVLGRFICQVFVGLLTSKTDFFLFGSSSFLGLSSLFGLSSFLRLSLFF